jgi:hypothetical protein
MRRFIVTLLIAILTTAPSSAFWHGISTIIPAGTSQMGLNPPQVNPQTLTNIFKGMEIGPGQGSDPKLYDINQYPISTLAQADTGQVIGPLWPGATYKFSWPSTRASGQVQLGGAIVIFFNHSAITAFSATNWNVDASTTLSAGTPTFGHTTSASGSTAFSANWTTATDAAAISVATFSP